MSRRNKLLIIIGVIILIAIIYSLVTNKQNNNNVGKAVITVNKGTGQTIITDPNQTPETYGSNQNVTILGANKLMPAGMTEPQLLLVGTLLKNYVNNQLQRKYTQVSILNDGFTNTNTQITAKLLLGNSQDILNMTILYPSFSSLELIISSDTNGALYNYDSGLQNL